ncbi:MAG TPA: hypothetical protein VKM55_21480 [Candidatus Lokiarchaeia archaeon]|nr:hypothetical protein [Candidatus Lokiarchaeia archaeon]
MQGSIDAFMARARAEGESRVAALHGLAKRLWNDGTITAGDMQARCMNAWDDLADDIGSRILPLVNVQKNRPITNVIFGSGGFSTGAFQAEQFRKVKKYTTELPVVLQGIVTNKSLEHGCNATNVSETYGIPIVELDFLDWYHEHVDVSEKNPVSATRYWYPKDDPGRPDADEMERRFSIRTDEFHAALGDLISQTFEQPTSVASARGYNFQFCSNMFKHQSFKPSVNDTHPADLTYIDPSTQVKLYPGWQSGAIQTMIDHGHQKFRGSLIEIKYMDCVEQVDELDEGALLAIGGGVSCADTSIAADQIQAAMKLVDDDVFCTLEPTGLILAWGITEDPVKVKFQDLEGNEIEVLQHAIVVGNEIRSGVDAWGKDLENDVATLEKFLIGK